MGCGSLMRPDMLMSMEPETHFWAPEGYFAQIETFFFVSNIPLKLPLLFDKSNTTGSFTDFLFLSTFITFFNDKFFFWSRLIIFCKLWICFLLVFIILRDAINCFFKISTFLGVSCKGEAVGELELMETTRVLIPDWIFIDDVASFKFVEGAT